MTEALEEVILKGAPISEGVSIGKLYIMEDFPDDIIPEFPIQSADVENEIARYRRAVLSSREDLHTLQRFLAKEGSSEAASIIDTHIQMLEDPFMTTFVEKKIRQMMKNTESVFRSVMSDYEREFSKRCVRGCGAWTRATTARSVRNSRRRRWPCACGTCAPTPFVLRTANDCTSSERATERC